MLERSAQGSAASASRPPGDRVGDVGATHRAMPLYTPAREPVTYGRAGLWIVIGLLVVLFAVFFGWVLFLR